MSTQNDATPSPSNPNVVRQTTLPPNMKLPAGITINNIPADCRFYTHQWDNKGKVVQSNLQIGNQNFDVTGQPFHKVVDNKFTITGSNVGNMIVGPRGPVNITSKQDVYEKGAKKTAIGISGGEFTNTNIGGKAVYNNQGAVIAGGGSGALRSETIKQMWATYNVSKALLTILKKGVTTEQLTQLLQKGFTLITILNAVEKKADEKQVQNLVNSMLNF
uniref:Uncharacterized LOC100179113 n=1 Tax=Ciona intestinalis TaxID=7719 RepID=A0A1W3JMX0_CIOIN|nr:uncharacterized protein LOC100179113 [Ciona intestinalis]|eukprot:XP_002126370.1 uncharacterized protein LOC100179113 [Ciona intestinalis]